MIDYSRTFDDASAVYPVHRNDDSLQIELAASTQYRYSVYYTNIGYTNRDLKYLNDTVKMKLSPDYKLVVFADHQLYTATLTNRDVHIIQDLDDLHALADDVWSAAVFFNFTLSMLRAHIHRIQRVIINFLDESNLSLIRFALIRDMSTLLVGPLRPNDVSFDLNNVIRPYRVVLDGLTSRRRRHRRQQRQKIRTEDGVPDLLTMSAFANVTRYTSVVYRRSLQKSFKYHNALAATFIHDRRIFNRFLEDLYREELWLRLLFTDEQPHHNTIDEGIVCNQDYSKKCVYLRINRVQIMPRMLEREYIKWQLYALQLYNTKKNLITSVPCELSVCDRPYMYLNAPSITMSGIDGFVVNSMCTLSDNNLIL